MSRLDAIIEKSSAVLEPKPTGYPPRLTPLPDIRAVVFDIYGTLLISASGDVGPDSAKDDEQAFRAAMHEAGLIPPVGVHGCDRLREQIGAAQQRRRSEGVEFPEVDIIEVWARVLESIGMDRPAPEQLQALALAYECRVNPVWPMPNMLATLETLHDAGLVMGIVSNAQFYTPLLLRAFTGAALNDLGFHQSLCVWSWRELEGKPSQRLYRKLLQALQQEHRIAPQQTLYVGNDRLKDIWPAASLGMRTALFAGDRRSLRLREDDARCNNVDPDVVIDDLAQIPRVAGL